MGQFIVAKVDKILIIPADKRSFPNEKTLEFNFKAGQKYPIGDGKNEVPEIVAKTYADSYPHIYKIVGKDDKLPAPTPEATPPVSNVSQEFDPVGYLEKNFDADEEKLKADLGETQLFMLCESMGLKAHPNSKKETLAAKIAQELKVRNTQSQEE